MSGAYFTTSWDDGHPSDLRVAEMLARHNLRGTFYIPRRIDTGVMSDGQIRELSSRFEIGAHTINHVFLDGADDVTARREIVDSKKWVADVTGKDCTMFCPPGGKFSARHAPLVRDARYAGIRTVEFMSLDAPRPRDGYVEMPTTLQAFPHRMRAFAKNMTKRRAVRNAWLYVTRGRGEWTRAAERIVAHLAGGSGVFHLWGHSWELDQAEQWERLEQVLRLMEGYAGQIASLENGQLCKKFTDPVSPVKRVQKPQAAL
jgi:peptidoglycan/xylan/chitin deacetylase (PgdA/CDA1 family)